MIVLGMSTRTHKHTRANAALENENYISGLNNLASYLVTFVEIIIQNMSDCFVMFVYNSNSYDHTKTIFFGVYMQYGSYYYVHI